MTDVAGARLTRSHALIVSIGKYEFGGDRTGLALQGKGYFQWLLARGVPPENITVLTSPLLTQEELGGSPAHLALASGDEVTRFLYTRVPDIDGDELLVFWSGHGVADDEDDARLFVSDASVSYLKNINLRKVCRFLRSDRMNGLRRQILLIDACQTRASRLGYKRLQADLSPPPADGELHGVQQDVLVAVPVGSEARYVSESGGGLFTEALLRALPDVPTTPWPPNAKELYRVTRSLLREQHGKYQGLQDPIQLRLSDEKSPLSRDTTSVAPVQGNLRPAHEAALKQLVASIEATMALGTSDIVEIVWASRAVHNVAPTPIGQVADLPSVLKWLDQQNVRADGLPPIVAFVLHMAKRTAIDDLIQDWVDQVTEDLNINRAAIARERARAADSVPFSGTAVIAISIDPYQEPGVYAVDARMQREGSPVVFKAERWTSGLTDSGLRATCQALLNDLGTWITATAEHLTIEFMLPWSLLSRDVEMYEVESGGQSVSVGGKAVVVIRSLDRLQFGGWSTSSWKSRWARLTGVDSRVHLLSSAAGEPGLATQCGEGLPVLQGANEFWALKTQIEQTESVTCLLLTDGFRPTRAETKHGLEAAVRAGVPAALWCWGDCDSSHLATELARIQAEGRLASLPQQVLRWRLGVPGQDHHGLGAHVAILWDNPYHLPLRHALIFPPDIGDGL